MINKEQLIRDQFLNERGIANEKINKLNIDAFPSFLSYQIEITKINEKSNMLDILYRQIKTPKMYPMSKNGNLMTLSDFTSNIRSGGFIDYDGFGKYATLTEESDILINPSDIKSNLYRNDFTHVNWYNR
jgi:hypothetical protein